MEYRFERSTKDGTSMELFVSGTVQEVMMILTLLSRQTAGRSSPAPTKEEVEAARKKFAESLHGVPGMFDDADMSGDTKAKTSKGKKGRKDDG